MPARSDTSEPHLPQPTTTETVQLPPRSAIRAGSTEVLVVGGGPAGLAAAIGAAQAGARVVLAERYGFLGGNATAALVMPFTTFHLEIPDRQTRTANPASMFPQDHAPGQPVIGGILRELINRLVYLGGAIEPGPDTGYTTPFAPEMLKLVAYDLLAESGVQLLLHSLATDLIPTPEGARVVFETKSGAVVLDAEVVIDCTGDGDLAAAAGANYQLGREEDGLTQPMTLMFRMGGVTRPDFTRYLQAHPDQWTGVHGLWDLIQQATSAGELDLPRSDMLMFATTQPDQVTVNSTRVTGVIGTNVWDLTRAELAARRQMRQLVTFLRDRVPGFATAYLDASGAQIGVRETRRIDGLYQLTADDVLSARRFEDAIAQGTYPVDIHDPKGRGTRLERIPQGAAYDIPLRCLIPRDTEHLLVAGRCISGDHVAHSSYRVMPIAMATGQAAGVCGAIASRLGKPVSDVPADLVRWELRTQGALLGGTL